MIKVKIAVIKTNGLITRKEESEFEKDKFRKVWEDDSHPFWKDPELIRCLREIESEVGRLIY